MITDKPALRAYLGYDQPFEFMGSIRFSTLMAGLSECRIYTRRDLKTGEHNANSKFGDEGNWLGAIGYFTILDQIGSCFKPLGKPEPQANANSIEFAIQNFGYDLVDNDNHQLNALIGLRNAFTHDFNLLNIPARNKPLQVHKFTVTAMPLEDWIVKLPTRSWDQNIDDKNFNDPSDTTFVNLFGFGSMVEKIYTRVVDSLEKDVLDIRLPTLRLINKYTFVTSHHPIK